MQLQFIKITSAQ